MKLTTKQAKHSAQKQSVSYKAISLILSAVILLSAFTGCDSTVIYTESGTNPDYGRPTFAPSGDSLNIGYSADDSLNPYFAKTDLNSDLMSLIFEPLFNLDDTFLARNSLAESYTVNEQTLTVKLNKTAAFSDGVQFSSADVVYSFNLAKASENWSDELANITSAQASGADTVVFSLSAANKNAADSLTFPIVKTQTANDEKSIPLGTGLYKTVQNGESVYLDYNPYCRTPYPNITRINLVSIPSSSTLIHTLELGTIDAFFDDMSSGSFSQANAQSSKTNLSNLVFLGMNSNSYGLATSAMRQAIYYSVNRQSIVRNSFKNFAVESATPYHPEWHVIDDESYDTSSLVLDYSKAKDLMTNAGFKDTLNFTLIVYSGNNFKVAAAREISQSFQNIGINLTVSELTWDAYKTALESGAYDFYIGEVKLPSDMNLSAVLSSDGPVYGIADTDTSAAAYEEFLGGKISLEAFTTSFLQNIPFVPICFRSGALMCTNSISPAPDCDAGNVYKNIYEWNK